jgi:hypothetical protein
MWILPRIHVREIFLVGGGCAAVAGMDFGAEFP